MRPLLAGILIFLAGPSFALSCLPSDVVNSFRDAESAHEDFVIVHGTLSVEEAALPPTDLSQPAPETTRLPARMDGKALSSSGFDVDFADDITLELTCFGPWCGQAENGQEYLAFLKQQGSTHVMVVDPCYSWVFSNPSDDKLQQAIACIRGVCRAGNE